jgi:hypothetical protein
MQSTPNFSLGVMRGVSPLEQRCMSLIYRYFVIVFDKYGYLRERLETLNMLKSERCLRGFAFVVQFIFQPSRTYAQYDLAVHVSVPDIDETMRDAPASVVAFRL